MNAENRHSTGNQALDELLGGGLLPGTLTVVVGATGIGKTQLGVQYAHAGVRQEGKRGVFFDMTARGDSQSHADYARRLHDWRLKSVSPGRQVLLDDFFDEPEPAGDYLRIFDYQGRRVTKQDLEFEEWKNWQSELNAKLRNAIAFFYDNFVYGVRRVVVDGIEPAERPHESIQFNLFEYVYHQVLRKESAWVARDLFREAYRRNAEKIANHDYSHEQVSCLLLYTSSEVMLDELIRRPLDEGDAIANANTLILMGKVKEGDEVGRGLYVAKHRGSACSERVVRYQINQDGLVLE